MCHARTGPKGLEGLAVRQWTCSVCAAPHERDTNAARNILARGLAQMAIKETTLAGEAGADEAARNKAVVPSATAGVGHDPLVAGILVL